jgi:TonB family protein
VSVPRFNHELSVSWRKDAIAGSVVIHAVGILALIGLVRWLPAPHVQERRSQATLLYVPNTEIPPAPLVPPAPKITPPPPAVLAKLRTPPKITLPPAPEPPKIEERPKFAELTKAPELVTPKLEPKREVITGTFAANKEVAAPVKEKKEVVTNSFAPGSSAVATVQKPAREVQTGGFGDPNGVRGTSEKSRLVTVASVGGFDLPAGPGNGNGTGGAHGVRGAVASAGFGNGTAGAGEGSGHRTGTVVQTGFSQMAAAAPAPKTAVEEKPSLTPVEILFKPSPVYTQEARQLHLEGEVLVRVIFGAGGELRVEQVVRGLGHGLDEAALRAAQQIRFRPAKRNGQPYDSTALVHIVFELAN